MTSADWLSIVCIAGLLVVIAVVAVDRNRLRRRLDNAEGRVTGLSLDVDALQERLERLGSYLNQPQSWGVDETPPTDLADGRPVDRWTPPAPAPGAPKPGTPTAAARRAGRPSAASPDVSQQPSHRHDSAR